MFTALCLRIALQIFSVNEEQQRMRPCACIIGLAVCYWAQGKNSDNGGGGEGESTTTETALIAGASGLLETLVHEHQNILCLYVCTCVYLRLVSNCVNITIRLYTYQNNITSLADIHLKTK